MFAYIVENGSISATASQLELSKSVISQHTKSLQAYLSVTLIKRTTRLFILTEAGEQFYQSCHKLNAIADQAWSDAKGHLAVPKGRIRITAPNALMEALVTPAMTQLMEKYPLLKPELISADQHLDFMEHNIDVAIRVGPSSDSSFKQKRLGEFRDVLCGTVKHKITDGKEVPYIANAWQEKQITHTLISESKPDIVYKTEASCIANSFYSCLSLIESGAGVGLVPDFYMSRIDNNVTPLFPHHKLPKNAVYALNTFAGTPPLSVSVCIDAIEQQLLGLSC